jgi:DnaK suppressor protein
MNKSSIKELRERLEKEKASIEKELEKFAQKDDKIKGDWDTKFPQWDNDSGSSALERAADEVEEYSTLLPIEHSLELKLKDIESALVKIKKNKYGLCETCKEEIKEERLIACPEAKTCSNCK